MMGLYRDTRNKMKTTRMGYIWIIGYILVLYKDTGKEHGNYHLGFSAKVLEYQPRVSGAMVRVSLPDSIRRFLLTCSRTLLVPLIGDIWSLIVGT